MVSDVQTREEVAELRREVALALETARARPAGVTQNDIQQHLVGLFSGTATAQHLVYDGIFVLTFSAAARSDTFAADGEVNVYKTNGTLIMQVFDFDTGAWESITLGRHENAGTGSVLSATTSIAVAHGLAVTPTIENISITFGEQADNDYGRWWVDTIGATTFTLNVSADPGASNLDFGWRVVV